MASTISRIPVNWERGFTTAFPKKHGRHEFIQLGFFQHLLPHQLTEMPVAIRFGKFHVDAGSHR